MMVFNSSETLTCPQVFTKMTKTEAVQVNLIYLIFKLVHFFSGH